MSKPELLIKKTFGRVTVIKGLPNCDLVLDAVRLILYEFTDDRDIFQSSQTAVNSYFILLAKDITCGKQQGS